MYSARGYDRIFGTGLRIKVLSGGSGYAQVALVTKPDKRLGRMKGPLETRYELLCATWEYTEDRIKYER